MQWAAYNLLYREADEEGKQQLRQHLPLRSKVGADYTNLHELLAAQQWEAANQETIQLVLWVACAEKITSIDMKRFPCIDLCIIDQLWLRESGGRFGFSVQQRIYLEEKNPLFNQCQEQLYKLAERVGWMDSLTNSIIPIPRRPHWLVGNFKLSAPVGHLPFLWGSQFIINWDPRQEDLLHSFMERVSSCSMD